LRPVTYDLVRLWETLADSQQASALERLREPKWLLLWREGEQPVFGLVAEAEALALANLQQGGTFGEVCVALMKYFDAADVATNAGTMLLNWLELGMIQRIHT
jgi:hypothetical protein